MNKAYRLLLLTFVSMTVSTSLFSNSLDVNECSDIFIQIPYSNQYDLEINGSEEIKLSLSYPFSISYMYQKDGQPEKGLLWKIKLESTDDISNLFLNLIEKSKLSFDDSIWVLTRISTKLEELNYTRLSWNIEEFIADVLGIGDIFDLASKIIGYNTSSDWITVFRNWNKEELQETYEEYKELKKLISNYRTQFTFQKIYDTLDRTLDPNFQNTITGDGFIQLNDKVVTVSNNFFDFLGKYETDVIPEKLLKDISRFKHLSQIFDTNRKGILTLLCFGVHTSNEDLVFWDILTRRLLTKTLDVLNLGINATVKLIDSLSYRVNESLFLKDYSNFLLFEAEELLHMLKRFHNIAEKRIESSFFKDMPRVLTASNEELIWYIKNQTVNLFFPTWQLTIEPKFIVKELEIALKRFSKLLRNTYTFILKDSSSVPSTHRYDYFSDLNYLLDSPDYQKYLTGKYSCTFSTKLVELVKKERQN